ncbi:hypothetical protein SAMN04487970_105936 [Paenibacillus tianmuensis]|uniref:Uncharacterized protein n=1 Tax=Paenibacillus tianmuensis TaxID=624147 RepID=A0A1G4TNM8_9BACL|nr:hypothetical protein [Paenibacillus tianmuensis]SCW82976.1 hypothetical protein SAMN04487970_105936 [Paenibacillus tianmuensis]
MMFTLQRKSLIAVILCLMFAFIAVLPTASAAEEDPLDQKYVDITRVFEFKKGQLNAPPLTYYYEVRYPVGRFAGTLDIENPTQTFYHPDGSGYHSVKYTGIISLIP